MQGLEESALLTLKFVVVGLYYFTSYHGRIVFYFNIMANFYTGFFFVGNMVFKIALHPGFCTKK